MTDHIDLDAIESNPTEAKDHARAMCRNHSPDCPCGDYAPVMIDADTLLALVRAVRAAQALWPLSPRESWVGTRHLYVEIGYPAEQAPFAEFNAALAPFRKEKP